jgi:hypothetical protein
MQYGTGLVWHRTPGTPCSIAATVAPGPTPRLVFCEGSFVKMVWTRPLTNEIVVNLREAGLWSW